MSLLSVSQKHVEERDYTSESEESYSSVDADDLPSLVQLDDPARSSSRGMSGWLASLVSGDERGGRDSANSSSYSPTLREDDQATEDDLGSASSTNLLDELQDSEFQDAVATHEQFSDSAASHDSQYMFDNTTIVVNAERRSSSSIDPDHGEANFLENEDHHHRKSHSKRRTGAPRASTLPPNREESGPENDNSHRHSLRTKRHDRSLRRSEHGNKSHEKEEPKRRSSRRNDSEKSDKSEKSEKKYRESKRDRSGRSMTMRRKRTDSEKIRVETFGPEDKPKPKKDEAARLKARAHHPSVKRTSDQRPSSTDRRAIKDNTSEKHKRQYFTQEELASRSSASLLSVVKQEGSYDSTKGPSGERRSKKRPTAPTDHPYCNYDSVSEKQLRKEKKRLKHPKITGFQGMGRLVRRTPRPGSRPGSNALVLRSESRRSNNGVSFFLSLA